MLIHYKLITQPNWFRKNLLDKNQLPLIKITHRKLIIWYISNIRNYNFNIFSIKLRTIKIKINEFMLNIIFNNNLVQSSILICQKYILNKNNWINLLLLKALGKQGLWWKNFCLPVSIFNDSFNYFNNSYHYIHKLIYNLLYIIKTKKTKKFEQWKLFPKLTNHYIKIIIKLILNGAIKNKKVNNALSVLKQYYYNLIQFKLMELKIINNYNLNNVLNKVTYHINKQICSKIKIQNTKTLGRNNKFYFNNNLQLIEEKIVLMKELIKAYNCKIIITKRLQYINRKLKKLRNKKIGKFSEVFLTDILQDVKKFSDSKIRINNSNTNLIIQKLCKLNTISSKQSLAIIIKLFQKHKKFIGIFKHFINKTKYKLLFKLRHISRIIHIINRILLLKGMTTATGNKTKQLFYNYKILKLTKNYRVSIISQLINKYKKLQTISKKKIQKIDILTYIYNKLWIISKKKQVILNQLWNKGKKKYILINKKIKNKIAQNKSNNKILNNKKVKNKLNNIKQKKKILINKIITRKKAKKISNSKWKRLMLILDNNLKKKLINLKVIDINKIFRIIRRFPRYSYKIYSINKRPKRSILQIKRSKLFRIWNDETSKVKQSLHRHKKTLGEVMKYTREQYSIVKKKIDIIAWRNRKYFPKKKIVRNFVQLLHRPTTISRLPSIQKKWHRNFFLTSFGLSLITSSFHNKYMAAFIAKAATTTLFKNNLDELDVMWISYQINHNALGYLYLKTINNKQTAAWNYWSIYFLQKSIVSIYSRQLFYIVKDSKRFSPLKGYRNRMKLVCWKKGQTWINKLLFKRRLYQVRHWSIWKRRFPRTRLYKIYRNHKLPDKFYNNRFYINLWHTNYNIRSCRRILYKWRYRRNLVLKSLRFFYGQLNSQAITKLLILVNRRISIYNNRYDRFFCKLDNKLACQAYNFGLAQTSFWSNQFVKNGWLTISNPDKDIMFLNYLFKIKKFIFPINLFDPQNIYWKKWGKSYKFEQYKYLIMPQRKHNFLLTAGDLINFIYSSESFNTKFNDGNTLRMNLPINKNVLNGETYDYSVDNKFKVPTLIQREVYNTAVLLFNPRIQDLSISNRVNAEKILFSIRNVK